MGVSVSQYGRDFAEQQCIKVINTGDDNQVKSHLSLDTESVCWKPMLKDACRIQPLPDDMRRDTLKPEYQTRTARVVAAIRHTANNAWTCLVNIWRWNG